jgi:uncharacterized protein (DUF305 family)
MWLRMILVIAAIFLGVAIALDYHFVSAGGSDEAFMAANQKMMQHMEMKPTGNPDRDFVTMMIPHHQGAVDMAEIELQYGKDPDLRKLAQDIIASQKKEISFMQAWTANHP